MAEHLPNMVKALGWIPSWMERGKGHRTVKLWLLCLVCLTGGLVSGQRLHTLGEKVSTDL